MMTKVTQILFLLAFVTGCATSGEILNIKVISMTNKSVAPGKKMNPLGDVNTTYCKGEKLEGFSTANKGLVDRVTQKAQVETSADFLLDAVYTKNGDCVTVVGKAAK
jgi:hypothetical protein